MEQLLTDAFARKFYYLRLSITDACNFRCIYCLPDGYRPDGQKSFLSLDEIRRVSRAFTQLGTEKVRFTGGEPSMRRDFTDIIAAVRENSAIQTLAVTTNGYRLQREAAKWRDAGLTSINVSVDSLDARQFYAITGQDKFYQVMKGVDAAFDAGFGKVKINAVLMQNINDNSLNTFLQWIKPRPIQLRFIELMETGEGGYCFVSTMFPALLSVRNCLSKIGSSKKGYVVMALHRCSGMRIIREKWGLSCLTKKIFVPVVIVYAYLQWVIFIFVCLVNRGCPCATYWPIIVN